MKLLETKLKDLFIIEPEKSEDERGSFYRIWDKKIFQENGLNDNLVQISISFNKKKGTLRGMHFQKKPFEEAKIVRCTKGKIFDVVIDLRPESKTFMNWASFELDSNESKILYIPEGFAHGFLGLEKENIVVYYCSNYRNPKYERVINWNDKKLKINWPIKKPILSKKDRNNISLSEYIKNHA